jgi:hypothetical protein
MQAAFLDVIYFGSILVITDQLRGAETADNCHILFRKPHTFLVNPPAL